MTPRGTALITVYDEVPADLSHVGGPRHSWALDCIVQEVDVATGKPLFQWHSIGHVPFSESRQAHQEPAWRATKRRPFDYFHINSVSDGPDGTLLVSARKKERFREWGHKSFEDYCTVELHLKLETVEKLTGS